MPKAKADRLMRHCTDVLKSLRIDQRTSHICRLAENDQDFRRYFQAVLQADPFTDEAIKGGDKAWRMGIGIMLDAIDQLNPAHPFHREALEIWPPILIQRK